MSDNRYIMGPLSTRQSLLIKGDIILIHFYNYTGVGQIEKKGGKTSQHPLYTIYLTVVAVAVKTTESIKSGEGQLL